MKIPIRCFDCTEDLGSRGHIALKEFRTDGRYEDVCPRGHHTVVMLQQSLFEVLFEIGAYAIRDGYYREAVSSFTASLERLYEFFVRTVLIGKEIENSATEESWSAVSRQSERQLGAFIFLYTLEFGLSPPTLKQRQIEFRNDVVHRGTIPTKEEAIDYGQKVLDLARPIIVILRTKYAEAAQELVRNNIRKVRDAGAGVMGIPTVLNLVTRGPEWDARPLAQAIDELADWEAKLGGRRYGIPID